jgi:hypothetical protein
MKLTNKAKPFTPVNIPNFGQEASEEENLVHLALQYPSKVK